eukprot:SAG11_NODE_10482_length_828_cov_2.164609_1_plen_119_part_10
MAMPNLACYKCIMNHPSDQDVIAPCIGPPECVAHQFAGIELGSQAMIDMICTGLRTSLCDDVAMGVINEKREFFNCSTPTPPSFACSFDNDDVASFNAGAPFDGTTDECNTCITNNNAN